MLSEQPAPIHHPPNQTPYQNTPARTPRYHFTSGMTTPPSSSHSLRPQAVDFTPSAVGQEHHTLHEKRGRHATNAYLSEGMYTPDHEIAYDTSISSSSRLMQTPDQRPSDNMEDSQRVAHADCLQIPQPLRESFHNGARHYDQINNVEQDSESLSQADTSPTMQEPLNDCYGWKTCFHGLAPMEDIARWNLGTYLPVVPQYPANTLAPPPPSRPASCPRAASIAGSTGSFLCPSEGCSRSFESKSDMDHHERYHRPHARKHPCTLCNKAFHFPKDLKRHLKTHGQERHLFCTTIGCQYNKVGFKREDHRKRHMQSVHGAPKEGRKI